MGSSFSAGGGGLSGRFIPEQIERETNKQRLSVVKTQKEQDGFKIQSALGLLSQLEVPGFWRAPT